MRKTICPVREIDLEAKKWLLGAITDRSKFKCVFGHWRDLTFSNITLSHVINQETLGKVQEVHKIIFSINYLPCEGEIFINVT